MPLSICVRVIGGITQRQMMTYNKEEMNIIRNRRLVNRHILLNKVDFLLVDLDLLALPILQIKGLFARNGCSRIKLVFFSYGNIVTMRPMQDFTKHKNTRCNAKVK